MNKHCVLAMFAIAMLQSGAAYPDVFKCRTASGQTVFSDTPCSAGQKVEKARADESVSYEQQRQARDVTRRNAAQLQSIEAENQAYKESVRSQNAAAERADAMARVDSDRAKADADEKKKTESCAILAGKSTKKALSEAISIGCSNSVVTAISTNMQTNKLNAAIGAAMR